MPVSASMTGNIWKILVEVGQSVEQGQTVAIIEAMKMEMPVIATQSGKVHAVVAHTGQTVYAGDAILFLE